MTEEFDEEVQPNWASRRRVILGAALALCGMAVGSDAQGAVASSVCTSLHQEVELNASPAWVYAVR